MGELVEAGGQEYRFFYRFAPHRRRTSKIKGLKGDREGGNSDHILEGVEACIIDEMNVFLDASYEKGESAFLSGRLITDNILFAYEILNVYKQKRLDKLGHFAFRLDMSEAYDKVEWSFSDMIMLNIGFSKRSTISYFVVLNCELGRDFSPKRGLRQGEGLSSLM
ncbi:reverse transcriptase [Gossypium australe]|uniref:Reverse transcriptase n=1 Tax=Gossypium australe TaxID=47621 RepID=A0A5B6VYQ1_9ROSI|nr:reverse transcriptase [Gossypium australe]